MGRWKLEIDAKSIAKPLLFMVLFCVYALWSKDAVQVTNLRYYDDSWYVSTDIFLYGQYILSFFIAVMASRQFSEMLKPTSFEFVKTLPLSIFELWTKRRLWLLFKILIITVPTILLMTVKANNELQAYGRIFYTIDVMDLRLAWQASVIKIIVTANYVLVLSVGVLTVCRNEIISNCMVFLYFLLEMGPVGKLLGEHSVFWGCFSPFDGAKIFSQNVFEMVFLSALTEIYIVMWLKYNIR